MLILEELACLVICSNDDDDDVTASVADWFLRCHEDGEAIHFCGAYLLLFCYMLFVEHCHHEKHCASTGRRTCSLLLPCLKEETCQLASFTHTFLRRAQRSSSGSHAGRVRNRCCDAHVGRRLVSPTETRRIRSKERNHRLLCREK